MINTVFINTIKISANSKQFEQRRVQY